MHEGHSRPQRGLRRGLTGFASACRGLRLGGRELFARALKVSLPISLVAVVTSPGVPGSGARAYGRAEAPSAAQGKAGAASPAPRDAVSLADLVFCVEETNRYRARAGKAPLRRSTDLESFAAEGARHDHLARAPHQHFRRFASGTMAENEVPRWPLDQPESVQSVIRAGWSSFWAEGPGGGHFRNLTGNWSEVGCGVYILNGEVTIVQEFR